MLFVFFEKASLPLRLILRLQFLFISTMSTLQVMFLRNVNLPLLSVKHHKIRHMWEWRYSAVYSEPRHQIGVSGQLHAAATLPPGKGPRCPEIRRRSRRQCDSVENKEFPVLVIVPADADAV